MPAAGIVSNDQGGESDSVGHFEDTKVPLTSVQKADYQWPVGHTRTTPCVPDNQANVQITGKGRLGITEYSDEYRQDQPSKIRNFHARMFEIKK